MSVATKVGIGADHGGFALKQEIISYLQSFSIEVVDYGTFSEESVDYPDIASAVAGGVLAGDVACGILVCGTGIGISIAANKFPGIRAALVHDNFTARMSRQHNDANILCLGGRTTGVEVAKDIVKTWIETEFEGGRHGRRISKMDDNARSCWAKLNGGE